MYNSSRRHTLLLSPSIYKNSATLGKNKRLNIKFFNEYTFRLEPKKGIELDTTQKKKKYLKRPYFVYTKSQSLRDLS